jgi:hypothetical protein
MAESRQSDGVQKTGSQKPRSCMLRKNVIQRNNDSCRPLLWFQFNEDQTAKAGR